MQNETSALMEDSDPLRYYYGQRIREGGCQKSSESG